MNNKRDITPTPLREALRAAGRVLLRAGVFSLFVNILMLTGPLFMLQVYDRVLSSRSVETLAVLTLLTFGLFAAAGTLDFVRGALLARAGAEFENKLQKLTFDIAMDAARAVGAASERPLRDLRQIRQFVASPALTAFFDAPMTPFFLLIIYLLHWWLGVVTTIGLIVLLAFALINERWSRAANESAQSTSQQADRMAASALRNASAADAMGMRGELRTRWLHAVAQSQNHAVGAGDKIAGLTALSRATRLFLQSAILGTGALLAIRQEVSPGAMIAASIIAGRALAPVETVTAHWRNCASALFSFRRLRSFLAAGQQRPAHTKLPPPKGYLSVDKIYVQPVSTQKPIIKNVSFQLAPGEALGIIGPSAAGKSTLARALVGVERIVSGEVRLDGARLDHWDFDSLGRHIGYLPQEVELFAGTAGQNIGRFIDDDESENIIAAAEAAGAHRMALSLANGYETEIGEHGRFLSAGQRQRLGLARALYGEPVFVVLDEPNANLDAEGDMALANAVSTLKARGATTIIVAHRPSAIAYVDKLLMLADGEMKAFGPRDDVLKKIAPGLIASFEENIKKRQGGAVQNA